MTVPTKLINTTIEEFKAEGYETRLCHVNVDNRANDKKVMVVQLAFEKAEETTSES